MTHCPSLMAHRRRRLGSLIRWALFLMMLVGVTALPGSRAWAGTLMEGDRLLAQHRIQSALEKYRQVSMLPAGAGVARIRLGLAHLRRGQWQEAAERFREVEAGGPASREVLLGLADALERLQDRGGSLEALRRELRWRPWEGDTWNRLVEQAARAGLPPEEIRALVEEFPVPPSSAPAGQRAAYLWGACLLAPDSQEGAASLRRAVSGPLPEVSARALDLLEGAEAGGEPGARAITLASLLLSQGLAGPALALLERVEERHPAYPEALALRGHALGEIGQTEGAEEALRRSVETAPGGRLGQFLLGSFLRVRGDPDRAADLLIEAARQEPANPAVYLELTNALVDLGDYGGAMRMLQAAVEAAPDSPELRLSAARFYVDRQFRLESALEDAREAVRLSGRSAAALSTLGWGLHLADKSGEALGLLAEAVDKDPESPLLRYRLASVLESLGRRDQAREQYLMVGELDGSGAQWQRAQAALEALNSLPVEGAQKPEDQTAVAEAPEGGGAEESPPETPGVPNERDSGPY